MRSTAAQSCLAAKSQTPMRSMPVVASLRFALGNSRKEYALSAGFSEAEPTCLMGAMAALVLEDGSPAAMGSVAIRCRKERRMVVSFTMS